MSRLRTAPQENLVDQTYQELLDAFDGLEGDERLEMACSLLITLCNHINDEQVVSEAVALSRETVRSSA